MDGYFTYELPNGMEAAINYYNIFNYLAGLKKIVLILVIILQPIRCHKH